MAATLHANPKENIRVGKVDCSVEKALGTRFGIQSYPSFYVVDGWSVYEFNDHRTETNLIAFVRGGYKKQEVSNPVYSLDSWVEGYIVLYIRLYSSNILMIFKQPLPLIASPYGPMGLLQGTLIYMGSQVMDFFESIQNTYGISPLIAGVVMCGLGMFLGLCSIILLAILTTPKVKNN